MEDGCVPHGATHRPLGMGYRRVRSKGLIVKKIVVVLVVVAGMLGFAPSDADAMPGHAANGKYEAIDMVDSSNLKVKIRNNRVDFRDDGATVCEDNGFGFVPARHRGRPVVVDATTVSVIADLECEVPGGWATVLPDLTLSYTWDEGTGLLTDSTGQNYTRA